MAVTKTVRGILAAAVAAAAAGFFAPGALAEGAFSLGFSGDIAKDGISYGYSVNNDKSEVAVEKSLSECRVGKNAPKMAALCKLVTTFRNECTAVAWDPKPGTPGMGIGFAATQAGAEERALAFCRMTVGAGRTNECKVDKSICDVTK